MTGLHPAGNLGQTAPRRAADAPVIVLSYAHSGARRVQDALAADTCLACTAATGVVLQCEAVAEAWRRVEGHGSPGLSRLAAATMRGLITAQVTAILTATGKTRWCELATAAPAIIGLFLQIFPQAAVLCVHRRSLDVIRAGVQASPWGLQGQGLLPYLLSYPGNSVAALAAHWAHSTEQLLAFEAANPGATYRLRYEDVAADPDTALTKVRAALRLDDEASSDALTGRIGSPEPGTAGPIAPEPAVPPELIPEPLRARITRLHIELGYPPLAR